MHKFGEIRQLSIWFQVDKLKKSCSLNVVRFHNWSTHFSEWCIPANMSCTYLELINGVVICQDMLQTPQRVCVVCQLLFSMGPSNWVLERMVYYGNLNLKNHN